MRMHATCVVVKVVPLSLASTVQPHAASLLKTIVGNKINTFVSNILYMPTSLAQLVQTSCANIPLGHVLTD